MELILRKSTTLLNLFQLISPNFKKKNSQLSEVYTYLRSYVENLGLSYCVLSYYFPQYGTIGTPNKHGKDFGVIKVIY